MELVYWNCRGLVDQHYACWDGSEWEVPNYLEDDLTDDHSLLTSIETDYILETSPSVDANLDATMPPPSMLMQAKTPIFETTKLEIATPADLDGEDSEDDFWSPDNAIFMN